MQESVNSAADLVAPKKVPATENPIRENRDAILGRNSHQKDVVAQIVFADWRGIDHLVHDR